VDLPTLADLQVAMDYHEKAFEYAGETVRQVLTLATGVIALTVTFAKDIIEPGSAALPWMKWGWTLFGVSIFFGILALMAIAGNLHADARKEDVRQAAIQAGGPAPPYQAPVGIYAGNIALFANLQIWTCFLALILTIRFGIIGMNEAQQRKATAAAPSAVTVTCSPCPAASVQPPQSAFPSVTQSVPAPTSTTTRTP
jgi:hypothetical protein